MNLDNTSPNISDNTSPDISDDESSSDIDNTPNINNHASSSSLTNNSKSNKVNFDPLDTNIGKSLDKWANALSDLATIRLNLDATKVLKKRDKFLKETLRLAQTYYSNNSTSSNANVEKPLIAMFAAQDQLSALESQNDDITRENKQLITEQKSQDDRISELKELITDNKYIMELHMDLLKFQLRELKMKGSKLEVVDALTTRDNRIQARVDKLYADLNVKIEQAQRSRKKTSLSSSSRNGFMKDATLTLYELNQVIVNFVERNAGSGGRDNIPETPDQMCMFGPLTTHFKSNRTMSTAREENDLSFAQYTAGPNALRMITAMKIKLDNLNIIYDHAVMRVNIKMKAARTLDYQTLFEENQRTKKRKNHVSLLATATLKGHDGAMLVTPVDDGGRPIGLVVMLGGYYAPDEPIIWQRVLNKTWQLYLGKSGTQTNVEGNIKFLRQFIPTEIVDTVIMSAGFDINKNLIDQLPKLNTEIYYTNSTSLFIDISSCTSLSKGNDTKFLKHSIVDPFIKRMYNLTKSPPFVNKLFFVKQTGDCGYIVPCSPEVKDHAEICFLFAYNFINIELPVLNTQLEKAGLTMKVHCGLGCGPGHMTFKYQWNRLKIDFNGSGTDIAAKCEAVSGSTSYVDKLREKCNITMSASFIQQLESRGLLDKDNMVFSWSKHEIVNLKFTSFGKCGILGYGKNPVEVFGYNCT